MVDPIEDKLRKLMIGRTITGVRAWETRDGGGAQCDVLSILFSDGSSVTLETKDTEQYCSWLVIRPASGEKD